MSRPSCESVKDVYPCDLHVNSGLGKQGSLQEHPFCAYRVHLYMWYFEKYVENVLYSLPLSVVFGVSTTLLTCCLDSVLCTLVKSISRFVRVCN